MIEIISNSPDETAALGKRIANFLSEGSVVALEGTLGSGKTCLVKGITSGLGITENITSPTYTIINEYARNNLPSIYHIDVYRLSDDRDFEGTGGLEIINSDGISLIEWSERIQKSLPPEAITISLQITEQFSRLIKIYGLKNI